MLALLGGAAATTLVGCNRDQAAETTQVAPDEDRARVDESKPEASDSATTAPTAQTGPGGPSPDESAGVVGPVARRLPAQGYRSISLSPFETVQYAVTVTHPDARFGEVVDQRSGELLAAADSGVRTVPPYQWRNATERAKTETAIRDEVQALLAKEGRLTGPPSAVQLDVQGIVKRPRRTAGIAPRDHFPKP